MWEQEQESRHSVWQSRCAWPAWGTVERDLGDHSPSRGQECVHMVSKSLAGLMASACFHASGYTAVRCTHPTLLSLTLCSELCEGSCLPLHFPGRGTPQWRGMLLWRCSDTTPYQNQQGSDTSTSTRNLVSRAYSPVRSSQKYFNFNLKSEKKWVQW